MTAYSGGRTLLTDGSSAQTCAWCIALAQIAIEGVGVLGTIVIKRWSDFKKGKLNASDLEADFGKVAEWAGEFNDELEGMTPKGEKKGGAGDA